MSCDHPNRALHVCATDIEIPAECKRMPLPSILPSDYWQTISITKTDIERLTAYLFEHEQPLTDEELLTVWVEQRLQAEREAAIQKQQAGGKLYLPREHYQTGEALVFPALGWKKGTVCAVRAGVNPTLGEFEVITVQFNGNETREFAAGLAEHKLNQPLESLFGQSDDLTPQSVLEAHGDELAGKLLAALEAEGSLVRVAGRWFPRALLTDINVGHLNLVEAILEEAGGQPLPTSVLLQQLGLGEAVSPVLEFSLNQALYADERFDEVGPAGEVLWCLRRTEPEDVRTVPATLHYIPIEYDRSLLTEEMLALEAQLDDELSELPPPRLLPGEVTITLTYPHWRAGTLPVSARMRGLFPSAYEAPRVRFALTDGESGKEIPAWVVRQHAYVAGLGELYQKYNLMPGSLITIRRDASNGKVIVQPHVRRPTRDWVRTVLVGSDGGIVFANLKQNITTEYDERMVIYVPDAAGVDEARAQTLKARLPFEKLVETMMRELSKLNVQGHVHAQEAYSAVNIIRRCPPGPLLAALAQTKRYTHVGDLHFRLISSAEETE